MLQCEYAQKLQYQHLGAGGLWGKGLPQFHFQILHSATKDKDMLTPPPN